MSSIIPNAQSLTEIISLPKESVIYFHIKNCRFCSTVGPVFETIASVRTDTFEGVTLGRFNMTEHRETVEKLGVKDITEKLRVKTFPTIVLYYAGEELSRIVGSHSQAEFEAWLMKSLRNREINHENGTPTCVHSANDQKPEECQICNELTTSQASQQGDGPACTGFFEDRPSKNHILLGRNREAFKDPEPECVIRINPKQKGMQIGRANDRSSYFAISLWIEPRESPGKIFFGLDFMPDPVVKERFQSASFHVTFGHDDPEGQHPPLKILDISSSCIGEDRDAEESSISTFSVSSDNISNETITTDTDVIGQGLHSPTAVWSLTEDASKIIKRGLDGHYRVSVRLPTTSRVWIKYYGKAVLVGGGIGPWRRVTLQSGSVEAPYRRILDLSEVVEGGM